MLSRMITTRLLTYCEPVLPRRGNSVANSVLTVLLTGKNLLLGWRCWFVGAASEPLRLRVAGGRRWLAY